jgi:hypothetical protein
VAVARRDAALKVSTPASLEAMFNRASALNPVMTEPLNPHPAVAHCGQALHEPGQNFSETSVTSLWVGTLNGAVVAAEPGYARVSPFVVIVVLHAVAHLSSGESDDVLAPPFALRMHHRPVEGVAWKAMTWTTVDAASADACALSQPVSAKLSAIVATAAVSVTPLAPTLYALRVEPSGVFAAAVHVAAHWRFQFAAWLVPLRTSSHTPVPTEPALPLAPVRQLLVSAPDLACRKCAKLELPGVQKETLTLAIPV